MLGILSRSVRRMATQADLASRLIWIDCEMTGLDYNKQTLVEIAVIVTDENLKVVAEGPDIVIRQPKSVLDHMEQWPRDVFLKNGLMEKIENSTVKMEEAEKKVLEFLEPITAKGKCPLAGNTVHMDARFIEKYMPRLAEHFHYRIVDVSTVKELSRRWYPEEWKSAPEKAFTHRALDDIRESIKELQYYRQAIFKST